MHRTKTIGLAVMAALTVAAPASAEMDHNVGAMGPGDAEAKWQGTGSGILATQDAMDEAGCTAGIHDCYDALIEIKAPGKLTVTTSSTDPKNADTDLQLFESDDKGNVKKELGESAQATPTSDESVSASVKPGFYVARIDYAISAQGVVDAVAVFKASGAKPATPAPGTGTPTPGTGTPTPANGTPEAKASKPKGKIKGFSGTASDDSGVSKVEIGVITKPKGGKCKELNGSGKLVKSKGNCNQPTTFLAAKGTSKWTFKLKKKLAKGNYILFVRAIDNAGATQAGFGPANKIAFKVK